MRRLSFGLMEDSNTLAESRMGISIFGGSISRSSNIDIPGINPLSRKPPEINDSIVTVSFLSCDCFTCVTVSVFKEPPATEAISNDVSEYVRTFVSFISSSASFTMILGTFRICVANFRSFSSLAASDIISASEMEIVSTLSFKCSNSDSASAFACFVISSTTLSTIFGDSTKESIVCSSDSCKNFTADSNSEISELDCEFSMTVGVSACRERFSLTPSNRISCDNSSFASLIPKSTDSSRLLSKSMSKSFCCKLLSVPRDSSIIFSLSAVSLAIFISSFIFKLLSSFSVVLSLLGILILASFISLPLFVKQLAITTLSFVFMSFDEEFSLSDIRVISKNNFTVNFSTLTFSFELSCNKEISITFDCTSFKLASVDSSTTDLTFSSIIGGTLTSIDSFNSIFIESLDSFIFGSSILLSTFSTFAFNSFEIGAFAVLFNSEDISVFCSNTSVTSELSSSSCFSETSGSKVSLETENDVVSFGKSLTSVSSESSELYASPINCKLISVFSKVLCSVIINDSVCVLLSQTRSDIPCCIFWILSVHFSDTILDLVLEISILSMFVIQTVLEVGLGIIRESCCVIGFKFSNCKIGSTFDSVIICERAAISLSKVESPI
ncbi:hypothetical protein ALC62_10943 [Cyphomyrmex costatus]|uniref:Uncharacterized protein n=1 Tax=Cyphomyrmex costatus TaxID=456900 RepID=A0A151ID43_9HYME|nr:hypothetical protein ALC62_10943 [Cyphomyrmex costatus]